MLMCKVNSHIITSQKILWPNESYSFAYPADYGRYLSMNFGISVLQYTCQILNNIGTVIEHFPISSLMVSKYHFRKVTLTQRDDLTNSWKLSWKMDANRKGSHRRKKNTLVCKRTFETCRVFHGPAGILDALHPHLAHCSVCVSFCYIRKRTYIFGKFTWVWKVKGNALMQDSFITLWRVRNNACNNWTGSSLRMEMQIETKRSPDFHRNSWPLT